MALQIILRDILKKNKHMTFYAKCASGCNEVMLEFIVKFTANQSVVVKINDDSASIEATVVACEILFMYLVVF